MPDKNKEENSLIKLLCEGIDSTLCLCIITTLVLVILFILFYLLQN